LFKLEDINTANPIFDQTKFDWLNGLWIRSIEGKDLKQRLIEHFAQDLETLDIIKRNNGDNLIKAASSRMKTLTDFKALVSKTSVRDKTKEEQAIAEKLKNFLAEKLKADWTDEELLTTMKEFSKSESIPFKTIFFLMTGKEQGIGILELNQIYGKDFFLNNLTVR
jgi:glutamyl/glutaminyl-tRNA synthetase